MAAGKVASVGGGRAWPSLVACPPFGVNLRPSDEVRHTVVADADVDAHHRGERERVQLTIQAHQRPRTYWVAAAAVGAGAVVAVALGVYGSQHQPTGRAISTFGFGSLIAMKVWLGVAAGGWLWCS